LPRETAERPSRSYLPPNLLGYLNEKSALRSFCPRSFCLDRLETGKEVAKMSSRHQADSSPRSLPDHAFLAVASYVLLRFGHMSLRTQRCWQLQRVLRPWIGRLLANLLVLCSLFVLAPCATGAIQLTALLWRAGEKVLTDDGFYAVPNWHINGFSWPIAVPVGYPLSAATLYVTHSPNSTPYQMILVGCGQYGVSFTSGVQGIGATNAPFTVRFDVSSTDPLSTCVKKLHRNGR